MVVILICLQRKTKILWRIALMCSGARNSGKEMLLYITRVSAMCPHLCLRLRRYMSLPPLGLFVFVEVPMTQYFVQYFLDYIAKIT